MNVTYREDDNGNWKKVAWDEQCGEKVFIRSKCQGKMGHAGVHWCYSYAGDFCYSENDSEPDGTGCSGSIPPGHKSYRHPQDMLPFRHLSEPTVTDVTDPAEVARISEQRLFLHETVDRPCTEPEILEKLKGRL